MIRFHSQIRFWFKFFIINWCYQRKCTWLSSLFKKATFIFFLIIMLFVIKIEHLTIMTIRIIIKISWTFYNALNLLRAWVFFIKFDGINLKAWICEHYVISYVVIVFKLRHRVEIVIFIITLILSIRFIIYSNLFLLSIYL